MLILIDVFCQESLSFILFLISERRTSYDFSDKIFKNVHNDYNFCNRTSLIDSLNRMTISSLKSLFIEKRETVKVNIWSIDLVDRKCRFVFSKFV